MARPTRCRRICSEPQYDNFSPCGKAQQGTVLMTVDEYEIIRLVDYEKRTHEECATLMAISRTTATEIYERARGKLADCLVNGKTLRISGGNYRLCDGSMRICCRKPCQKTTEKGQISMNKIAVTYENGQIFQHFGRTEQFKLYTVKNSTVVNEEVISTLGSGHGALAGLLVQHGVDTLVCGGIGGGAQMALAEMGIKLYGGVSGDADEAVNSLLSGKLDYNPDVHCDHHHHEEGHSCHSHSCTQEHHGCQEHQA